MIFWAGWFVMLISMILTSGMYIAAGKLQFIMSINQDTLIGNGPEHIMPLALDNVDRITLIIRITPIFDI